MSRSYKLIREFWILKKKKTETEKGKQLIIQNQKLIKNERQIIYIIYMIK